MGETKRGRGRPAGLGFVRRPALLRPDQAESITNRAASSGRSFQDVLREDLDVAANARGEGAFDVERRAHDLARRMLRDAARRPVTL